MNNDLTPEEAEVMRQYADIIGLPHHVSATHARMSMESRAAQFAPFAALNGHSAAIERTGEQYIEKMEGQMAIDNSQLTIDNFELKIEKI